MATKSVSEFRKQNGLCVECGNSSDNNLTTCEICRERRKQRRQERRERNPEEFKKLQSAAMARYRKNRFEAGFCWRCSENQIIPGQKLCQECNYLKNAKMRSLKQNRIDCGLCKDCGKFPITAPQSKVCYECFFKTMSKAYLDDRNRWTELEALFLNQNKKCPYTGIELTPALNASLDHIIAKSAGGSGEASNFQWVYFGDDFDINMMKRNFSEDNFMKAVKMIYEHKYHLMAS